MSGFVGWISRGDGFRCQGEPAFEDQGLTIFYRGYIANAAGAAAARPNGPACDGARFVQAYRRWGWELQRHVLGEYALVVVDRDAGTVLFTQDGLGVQPLFVADLPDRIAFSSHLHMMVDVLPTFALDETYMADHLRLCRHIGSHSPYRGVTRLIGGDVWEWRGGSVRRKSGWSLADVALIGDRSEGEYDEEFRALLREAVGAAAPEASKCWIELSGGLDSSSIACIAADLSMKAEAVSVTWPQTPAADERPWMRKVIEKTGLAWNTLDAESLLPFSCWPDTAFGEPNMSICTFAHVRGMHQMAADHGVDTILSGAGGDFVLMGDRTVPVSLGDDLLGGRLHELNRAVRLWQQSASPMRSYRHILVEAAIAPAWDHVRGRSIRLGADMPMPSYLHPDLVRRHALARRERALPAIRCDTVGGQHFAERVREASISLSLSVHQYPHARDLRYPLMYRPLVEFMYAVPWEQKLRPGVKRALQRRAMVGILPNAVIRRVSKGSIEEPCMKGLKQSADRLLAELTEDSRLVHHGLVEERAWRAAVNLAVHGMVEGLSLFMAAVSAEIWLRQTEALFARRGPKAGDAARWTARP